MNKKNVLIISLLIIVLFLGGCNSKEKRDSELEMIMDHIVEANHNQSFETLIDALLANEQYKEVLKLASEELNKNEKELKSFSVKTNEAKEVIDYYKKALDNRKEVIAILEENKLTEETKEKFEKYLLQAEENEYKATGIIVDKLNIKDIEN